ncbi:sialate O-acetylesterase [Paenibacillus cymbidii]|uniref:sialate O-acetylesterase n=1 Tax=Paenibacillus cymbidii TaxID=1639034 RepID=UPI0010802367|nr:sialate O-acetylesterase [Paenibacillus cymbidii]
MSQIGVIIMQGPQHWSIVQQRDSYGTIALSGTWAVSTTAAEGGRQVYARVVDESTGAAIVEWKAATMQASQGWEIEITQVPAGGLYRIETCLQTNANPEIEWASRGDMIHHVGVGDLWIIAGQSNAAGYGRGPVLDPPEIGIHLLRHSGRWDLATHPFNESTDTIHPANRERANPGHSPFLAFAKIVKRHTGYPIGLIQTALGGSALRAWNPEQEGHLYRNMIDIVSAAGGSVAGMVWYQGCSDCIPSERDTYAARFRVFVERLRADLGNEALPVITVQLNRKTGPVTSAEENLSWGTVREQQRVAARVIPHVSIVPAIDCPLSDEIHNSSAGNLLIGERMARSAIATVYGGHLHYQAPEVASAVYSIDSGIPEEPAILVSYAFVGGYLLHTGQQAPLYAVEDEAGDVPVLAWTIFGRDTVRLTLGRPLVGHGYINGGAERNPSTYLPLDSLTYMPPLSFFRYPVTLS